QSVFQENTYIIMNNKDAVILDPGDEPSRICAYLDDKAVTVRGVLATHGHLDHVMAAASLCERYACPFIMSGKDKELLENLESMCGYFRTSYYGTPGITIDIADQNEIVLGDIRIKILHTPGHTPGGVSFLTDSMLFSGDTLFRRSVGRTDMAGGDRRVLTESVTRVLYPLPASTIVHPGHGPSTTIGEERAENPFIKA
ncbi:MAG: MBL fold metallo-hydrolase, partial [Candidatus Marinimicrobia bacterium]|nr:MBL fold metallo-hydrolase [Candidatus Neomarinimicrobiota bacterium]